MPDGKFLRYRKELAQYSLGARHLIRPVVDMYMDGSKRARHEKIVDILKEARTPVSAANALLFVKRVFDYDEKALPREKEIRKEVAERTNGVLQNHEWLVREEMRAADERRQGWSHLAAIDLMHEIVTHGKKMEDGETIKLAFKIMRSHAEGALSAKEPMELALKLENAIAERLRRIRELEKVAEKNPEVRKSLEKEREMWMVTRNAMAMALDIMDRMGRAGEREQSFKDLLESYIDVRGKKVPVFDYMVRMVKDPEGYKPGYFVSAVKERVLRT